MVSSNIHLLSVLKNNGSSKKEKAILPTISEDTKLVNSTGVQKQIYILEGSGASLWNNNILHFYLMFFFSNRRQLSYAFITEPQL